MLDLRADLESISRKVGQFLKSERTSIAKSDIIFKGRANDLVSRADKEAEVLFISFLEKLLPESGFIAEEGTSQKVGAEYNWIIDPLDGTTNYLYGIPCYCTSVALQKGNELILGVIYDPERDECFTAATGQGATLNGEPIHVSAETIAAHSLIAMGFPYDNKGKQLAYLDLLAKVNAATRGVRRLGSAALDMAYVACGRFDAFYEYGLHPWDCAAGAVIVREAGGMVTNFRGGEEFLSTRTMVCGNEAIHAALLPILSSWE